VETAPRSPHSHDTTVNLAHPAGRHRLGEPFGTRADALVAIVGSDPLRVVRFRFGRGRGRVAG
jgi:hypothetical protein